MSDAENHHNGKNEIIIIKRHGGGDHEGGHGGAWKIAYADFMTALMAFFLVMWLVNASNAETKASVASYFNPIKLADTKPTEKGLKKPVDAAEGEQKQEKSKENSDQQTNGASAASGEDQTSTAGDQTNYSEADFFENPYSVLSEIAQEVGQQANVSAKGEGGASTSGPATGADGGKAYRDPFDPDFWTKQVKVTPSSKPDGGEASKTDDEPKGEVVAMAKATASDNGPVSDKPQTPETQASASDQAQQPPPDNPPIPEKMPEGMQKPMDAAEKAAADAAQAAETAAEKAADAAKPVSTAAEKQDAKALQATIQKEIGGVAGKLAEGLIVTPAEGGLLVTISDQSNDPMFNIGSAVPRKEMVLAMAKIGKILADRPGAIVLRGHTDGRQYKAGESDNWRLSLDRAQSAYYMLVHGGLDEKRISQVSGFADRRLKMPEDPFNNANRRIEILVQGSQG
ncbi:MULTISPECIES: MotB family protein [unclassified Rhizobium]|uniref:MotB family protein n=1 Tax=unclassified Rhizobium TaxID=2613769 RepID=UPI001ADAB9F4|nr:MULTISPECIES: MotB family protein [unclassified Rhizobium]MBO9097287.1 MotB family protein [Rhizobium sp. L58/93]MBO9133861.1 MotB family protein [Rhizobium sp. B209b/85]MBO9167526.1 MotB family protein [Rhizobium sp. L245/93]MBO9183485.1 MotB family protein [Rhizobium sp. E27B/91]QXZ83817.1 MotB family protein [Rhizobium sp. K1/93]